MALCVYVYVFVCRECVGRSLTECSVVCSCSWNESFVDKESEHERPSPSCPSFCWAFC